MAARSPAEDRLTTHTGSLGRSSKGLGAMTEVAGYLRDSLASLDLSPTMDGPLPPFLPRSRRRPWSLADVTVNLNVGTSERYTVTVCLPSTAMLRFVSAFRCLWRLAVLSRA